MSWRTAPSVAAALSQASSKWPARSRASDGTIGDAAHSARHSDHNPDARGIVHAFDLTHDPVNGVDCDQLAANLIQRRDSRVQYIIWNRRICNASNWTWRAYTGSNPHTKHMHVSIKLTTTAEKDTSPWWASVPAAAPAAKVVLPPVPPLALLRLGNSGKDVSILQLCLKDWGWEITVDGEFGPKTRTVVVEFQQQEHLRTDGIVGSKTWASLWSK